MSVTTQDLVLMIGVREIEKFELQKQIEALKAPVAQKETAQEEVVAGSAQ